MTVDSSPLQGKDIAGRMYHEMRHAEQFYCMAFCLAVPNRT
jgi:hypothetical protein